jgi:putative ABC transport system permease protein
MAEWEGRAADQFHLHRRELPILCSVDTYRSLPEPARFLTGVAFAPFPDPESFMRWFHAARARLRLLSRRAAESRIDEEIRFHVEMETQRLVREQSLDHDEARRRALATFGGVQQHREALREGRGTDWLSGMSLDLKLGARMLVKYPALTVVGGLAMAFGIWFGAVTFQMAALVTSPKLPLPDGDRIVKIQNWDAKTLKEEKRVLYDYQVWRAATSVTDVGAYRNVSVNLVGANGPAHPVVAAEITATAFRIAPARPLFGRVLDASDERPGAPAVVLLGHDVWKTRFDSDPLIVGRNVQLGDRFATVVGVMPDGYAFPVAHELWLPLRTDVAAVEPRGGADITVFGRLASGMTLKNARAEFSSLGRRLAMEQPATHASLQPHVIHYAKFGMESVEASVMMALTYTFLVALVVVVCSTVALLLFARAAARETEILIRSALGASRRRIVAQLFAEALVLAGVAAVAGLLAAQGTLTRWGQPYLEINYGRLPFWYDFNLSWGTIISALSLAVISAVVAGVMPARKITRGLGTQLRAGNAGAGVSFGGVWTAVIVAQIALTVALPSVVMLVRSEVKRIASYDAGFPTQEFLAAALGTEGPLYGMPAPATTDTANARFSNTIESLRQRVEAEPGVAGVTFVDRLPGESHVYWRLHEMSVPGTKARWITTAAIHPSYFDVLQAPVISGRAFTSADLSPDSRVVIVDQGFVDRVAPGRNLVGHRVRLTSEEGADSSVANLPWYEIIGVVKELGMRKVATPQRVAGLYFPSVPGRQGNVKMLVHTRGNPQEISPRIRELAMGVDASLQIDQVMRLDQVLTPELWMFRVWMRIIIGLTAVALLLSLSGIYAVLAYTVARRTREIGVRVALGAGPRRVVTSIFRRPLIQVSLGVIGGIVIIALAAIGVQNTGHFSGTEIGGITLGDMPLLAGYAILMFGVCSLACVVPTLRALRVQPTEAMRAD